MARYRDTGTALDIGVVHEVLGRQVRVVKAKYRYRAYLLSSNGMSLPMPLGGVSKRECLENAKRFLQNLDAGKYSR